MTWFHVSKPVKSGVVSGWTGSAANWVVMKVCQILAGQVPPQTAGDPASGQMPGLLAAADVFWLLVNSDTDSEYCGIAPMNQASGRSRRFSVPVLAITGRSHAAFGYPVPPGKCDVLSNDSA